MVIGIVGTGRYLPEAEVGNAEIAALAGIYPAWTEERAGIRARRHAAAGQRPTGWRASANTRSSFRFPAVAAGLL